MGNCPFPPPSWLRHCWLMMNIIKFFFMTSNEKSICILMFVRDVDE